MSRSMKIPETKIETLLITKRCFQFFIGLNFLWKFWLCGNTTLKIKDGENISLTYIKKQKQKSLLWELKKLAINISKRREGSSKLPKNVSFLQNNNKFKYSKG